jgi:hypothetical protein
LERGGAAQRGHVLDPAALPPQLPQGNKAWRDVWSDGQGDHMTNISDAITIRRGNADDWQSIIDHSYIVRTENGFDPQKIRPHWQDVSRDFIVNAAENWHFGCIIAEHDGIAIGNLAISGMSMLIEHGAAIDWRAA